MIIFNSASSLFALARPFSQASELDARSQPLCPQGVCAYQARFATSLGRVVVRLTEGALLSVQAVVYAPGDSGEILLTLSDRNADGQMSFLDSVSGPLAHGRSPGEVYAMVRQAVARALSDGSCLAP